MLWSLLYYLEHEGINPWGWQTRGESRASLFLDVQCLIQRTRARSHKILSKMFRFFYFHTFDGPFLYIGKRFIFIDELASSCSLYFHSSVDLYLFRLSFTALLVSSNIHRFVGLIFIYCCLVCSLFKIFSIYIFLTI